MKNKFTGNRIEFHILQSFPVSCLNRDDVGAPKSALVGGTMRARVSSQCWKRAVRLAMHELGTVTAHRTKLITAVVKDECVKLGASPEAATLCGKSAAQAFTKAVNDKGESDTLFFISDSEAAALARAFQEHAFQADIPAKDLQKICKKAINPAHDGLDIALFGRMVASAADMNVEAAASFAHAISTHKVASEVDFFTAVDDCNRGESTGSGHMGSVEFNAATYYRYISLDLGQLTENLKSEDISDAVSTFVKALFVAVPAARQATMSAACPWQYAVVTVRKGQRIQLPFENAVRTGHECPDLLSASRRELQTRLEDTKKMFGSLFGEKARFEIGLGVGGSVDELIGGLEKSIAAL